ncbi:MAG: hypothetical protein K8U57_31645 [Planctomycetes bacterium]|nr:hypothetical protein [Planctomycetota bacterium]
MGWWPFFAVIKRARAEIPKVVRYMNLAQPEVTVLGITAPSAHQVLLDLTTKYSDFLLQELGFGCRTPGGIGAEPNTEANNQLIQDYLIAQIDQLYSKFLQLDSDWVYEFTRLKALLLAETSDAARRFEWSVDGNEYRVYRVKVRSEYNPNGASVYLDGEPKTIKSNEWKVLSALAKVRPNGLSKDELYSVKGSGRGILYDLQDKWKDYGDVISWPGTRGKGGYKLL